MNFNQQSPNPQWIFKLEKKQVSQNIGHNGEAVILAVAQVQVLSVEQSNCGNHHVPCLELYKMVLHFFHSLHSKSGLIDQGCQNCITFRIIHTRRERLRQVLSLSSNKHRRGYKLKVLQLDSHPISFSSSFLGH